ncbi:MAG: 30S ribosomal protein S6e [archaeon]
MNIVVSDPKSRKAYAQKVEKTPFVGKKIGDEVDLSEVGLDGYKAVITGGSDLTGTPMRKNFPGTARKKLLVYPGVGFRKGVKGERRKKPMRGNTIGSDIHQVNVKVTHHGTKALDEIFPAKAKTEEAK